MSTKDELSKNLEFYIANQQKIVSEHNGRILIIYRQEVAGAYPNYGEAYTEAMEKYLPGTFSLIKCSPGPESYTVRFSNLAHFAKVVSV
jgi:hypothetical protein